MQIVAALMLTLDGEPSVLWASQCLFAVEGVYLLFDQRFGVYFFVYVTGIVVETFSIADLRRFFLPKMMILAHVLLCLANCKHVDCLWQFPQGAMFWAGYHLNNAIIVALICYCLPSVNRRFKENYERSARPLPQAA